MFKDFDYTRKLDNPKLSLAKPNKQIIGRIPEAFGINVSVYDTELDQLTFSVPLFVEDDKPSLTNSGFDLSTNNTPQGLVHNENIDKLKEKMLIKATIGSDSDWFMIDSVEEQRSDEGAYIVSCFSLPYEMSHTNTGGDIEEETMELRAVLAMLLAFTRWKLGTISNKIPKELYRNIGFGDICILDALFQVAETYNVYLKFNSDTRTIDVMTIEEHSVYRGLNIDYGRLLDSYIIKRSSDEIVTRLTAYGADGMTIAEVNPTGLPYIEDYSYFMYPFEYDDAADKPIKSSFYMSDELATALYKYRKAQGIYENEIVKANEDILQLRIDISTYQSELDVLNMELDGIKDRLDTAKATEATDLINSLTKEMLAKNTEINQKKAQIDEAKENLEFKNKRLEEIQKVIRDESNFTPELEDELKYFTIERTWTNEDYVDPQELYDAALEQFEKQKVPKTLIDISVVNLLNVIEEDFYKDKLVVGDIARITDRQRNITYKAPIQNIDYDFDENTAQVKIADDKSLLDENGVFQKVLEDAQYTSDVVSSNGKYWNQVSDLGSEVSKIINGEWDANKNTISAGVNNEITMGKRGIMITNPDNPNEIIIMQSGIIALSEDKGETWKTAIKPTGIVAERLIGRIIVGEQLIIANESNSFILDENGAVFDVNSFKVRASDGSDLVSAWTYAKELLDSMAEDDRISPYEKKELRNELAKMEQRYNGITNKCGVYWTDPMTVLEYVNFNTQWKKVYEYFFVTVHEGDTVPMLDPTNVGTTININRTEFTDLFKDFESTLSAIETKMSEKTNEMLKDSQTRLDEINDRIDDISDDKPYTCRLTSTNGTIFLNNNVETTLIAELLHGVEDLTPLVPKSGFVWKRYDKDNIEDTEWTESHVAVGNKIVVRREDIIERATYEVSFYYDNIQTQAERINV